MSFSIKKVKDRRIKIAILGCGRISKNHIRAIALNNKNAELVAICDIQVELLKKTQELIEELKKEFTEEIKTPKEFTNYDDLLNSTKTNELLVDLLVIATPSGFHAEQTIAAAKNGIHVCTEKPMSTNLEDGKEMVRVCNENNVNLFVVKQNRLNSTLELVKRQLTQGRFGKISMVTVNVFWQRPQEYYDQAAWRGTWKLDGGALMNQASHYVDLLEWLIGPLESLSASIATIGRDIEAEDTAAIQMKWENGSLGTMSVTMLAYPKNLEGSITILGEKGSVKVGGPAVNKIEIWEFADSREDDKLVKTASYETTSVYGFGHPAYYKNMLEVLTGKAKPICDGVEGLKTLEILIAAYHSAKEKTIVSFPFNP